MSLINVLGALLQSGMAPSSEKRLKRALSDDEEDLARNESGGRGRSGLAGLIGSVLSQVAGRRGNTASGGLAGLTGALFGGGGSSRAGSLGTGAMALFGAMASRALQGAGQGRNEASPGLGEPQGAGEEEDLERQAEIVLNAMINAAKADGRIDEQEIDRIVGKLEETGADGDDQRYVLTQMQKPMETGLLISAARGKPELAAEIYAASLVAIEADTEAEKKYLSELASALELAPEVTRRIEQILGV